MKYMKIIRGIRCWVHVKVYEGKVKDDIMQNY